jgi:DNA-binding HxlR family transcriptional regulator
VEWLDTDTSNCTVARALGLVGDRWALLVLRDAFNGVHRFDELHRHLGIAPTVLTRRLDTLVGNGLMERVPYRAGGQRTRYEYRLTAKGWDLHPAVVALMAFGDKYLADPEGPPVRLSHTGCGAEVGVRVTCADGHDLTPRDITVEPGPSAHLRPVGA